MRLTLLSLGCTTLLAAAPLVAQGPARVHLFVNYTDAVVEATIIGPAPEFAGAVLVGLRPDLAHYFVGLPPLLFDSELLALGLAQQGELHLTVPHVPMPLPAVMFYFQAVTSSALGIDSSDIVKLNGIR